MAISVGAAILGSAGLNMLGGNMQSQAIKDSNKANYNQSKEFAQNSIQWRVQDAIKAGVHPLYAMGAPTMSPSTAIQPVPNGAQIASQAGSNALSQYAALNPGNPDQMSEAMKAMNFKLLEHQLNEAEQSNKLPPLFIQAYDPNPKSKTFGEKVWLYNPDLEMEGIIPTVATVYPNINDAYQGLKKDVIETAKKAVDTSDKKHPISKLQEHGAQRRQYWQQKWREIKQKFEIPDSLKKLFD